MATLTELAYKWLLLILLWLGCSHDLRRFSSWLIFNCSNKEIALSTLIYNGIYIYLRSDLLSKHKYVDATETFGKTDQTKKEMENFFCNSLQGTNKNGETFSLPRLSFSSILAYFSYTNISP